MIHVLYMALAIFATVLMIWNFVRSKRWEEEVLYVIVILPFVLRIFGLK